MVKKYLRYCEVGWMPKIKHSTGLCKTHFISWNDDSTNFPGNGHLPFSITLSRDFFVDKAHISDFKSAQFFKNNYKSMHIPGNNAKDVDNL